MTADKDLFLYDLAVVAIMKNEAPYVKEWLDYHILAGVDHFYIFDNESSDNFKEVLQPYINAGIVTYKFYPGTCRQINAYTEAFKTYRFFCRYMAFIDADEFIFPQNNKSIVEVADKFLSDKTNFGGLMIQWMMYGSNNLEKADYSKGVLERFTRRAAAESTKSVKTLCNPRLISYITTPHYVEYFHGFEGIDFRKFDGDYKISDKILINHYRLKSREEFETKKKSGCKDAVYGNENYYSIDQFTHEENNDVLDESILKYRENCLTHGGAVRQIDYEKLVNALMKNLSPLLNENLPIEFFKEKLETFLICRALASYLKENILGNERGIFIEKLALRAVYATTFTNLSIADSELLFSELPNILPLKYPEVRNIFSNCLKLIPQIQSLIGSKIDCQEKFMFWRDVNELDNLYRILKSFEGYLS